MNKPSLTLLLICTIYIGHAQVSTSSALPVSQYITDVLFDDNVVVSNITINGQAANTSNIQVGQFEASYSNVGIAQGMIIATGDVSGAEGPNNSGSTSLPANGLNNGNDPDVLSIVEAGGGDNYHDWIIIEFDFVPVADSVAFRYVFGSEDYPEWVSAGGLSNYSDCFGFFLSGPGISGPYTNNAINMATVPGTDVPICVGTLNNGTGNNGPCKNCAYYNQDGDGYFTEDASYTNPYYMQYDGYTDVLTAKAAVQCSAIYHAKLTIADAGDAILDAAVFLEGESYAADQVVQVEMLVDADGPNGNILFEDCAEGAIVFHRPSGSNIEDDYVIYLTYSGSAEMGIDYSGFPDSLIIPAGLQWIDVSIDATNDMMAEGVETVVFEMSAYAPCAGELITTYFTFEIWDTAAPLTVSVPDLTICAGATTTLVPDIQGGYGNYQYLWNTSESTESITVAPTTSTVYTLTVSDTCGVEPATDYVTVTVLDLPPLTVSLNYDALLLECNENASLLATATGGQGDYDYYWTDEQGNNLYGWLNTLVYYSWNGEGMVIVRATDACNMPVFDSLQVDMLGPNLWAVTEPVISVPCGEPFFITPSAFGGTPPLYYQWYTNGVLDEDMWQDTYQGVATNNVVVTCLITDNCGQEATMDITVMVEGGNLEMSLPNDFTVGCYELFDLVPTITGASDDAYYLWTANGIVVSEEWALLENFANENTTYILTITDVCNGFATDTIVVNSVTVPLTVADIPDLEVQCGEPFDITPIILTGNGGYQFEWQHLGITFATGPTLSNYTADEQLTIVLEVGDACNQLVSQAIYINVIPLAAPEITQNANDLSTDLGYYYQWLYNGEPILENAHENIYTVQDTGWYSVLITNVGGCVALSDPYYMGTIGTDELGEETIYLFPNPMSDEATLVLHGSGPAHITLTDAAGRLVRDMGIATAPTLTIARSTLAPGLYRVVVRTDNITKHLPLMVE